jgi:hypothetical protein
MDCYNCLTNQGIIRAMKRQEFHDHEGDFPRCDVIYSCSFCYAVETGVLTCDGEYPESKVQCTVCADNGRFELCRFTDRHDHSNPLPFCTRLHWCFVCGSGGSSRLDCDGSS